MAVCGTNYSSFETVGGPTLDLDRPAALADDRAFLRLIARHYEQTVCTVFRREHPRGLLMGDAFTPTARSPYFRKDAAVLLTLPPGAYTASVSGANGTRGVALIEIYELP